MEHEWTLFFCQDYITHISFPLKKNLSFLYSVLFLTGNGRGTICGYLSLEITLTRLIIIQYLKNGPMWYVMSFA